MIIERIQNLFYKFLDIIFPENCRICNSFIVHPEKVICRNCLEKYSTIGIHPIEKKILHLKKIWYITKYSDLAVILLEAKERYRKDALVYLIDFLKAQIISLTEITNNIDIIIPVPLTKYKKKERGFSQSEIIASKFFIGSGKVDNDIVTKIKNTKDQKSLSRLERMENLKGAFSLNNPNKIFNKRILVVDDVLTTGSTISEIAELLLTNGCKEVYAFCIFKA